MRQLIRKKKILLIVLTCAAVLVVFVLGTLSYYADKDKVSNVFTIGEVKILLNEPNYNPTDKTPVVQGEVVTKDPTVTNIGTNDAVILLEVDIPAESIVIIDKNNQKEQESLTELFVFTPNTSDTDVSGWILLSKEIFDEKVTYRYGYNTVLAPDESTISVFDSVTYQKVMEKSQDGNSYDIDVRAYAIQTGTINGTDVEAGDFMAKEQLEAVYTAFVNQTTEE